MEANPLTLDKLFGIDVQYSIPRFQRRYVWQKDDQWIPLWDDVREVAEGVLGGSQESGAPTGHFLGAVVLQKQNNTAIEPQKRDVIDGQQRLTTLQLLIHAAATVLREHKNAKAEFLDKLLRNDELYNSTDEKFRLKIRPTPHDRAAFRSAMESTGLELVGDSQILGAERFFVKVIREWLAKAADETALKNRCDTLIDVLNQRLSLIVIEADGDDDANLIFETLNARGTPLLAWHLVKNNIDNGLPQNAKLDLEGFDNDWWQDEIGRGKDRKSRIDRFLVMWLEMRTRSQVDTKTPRKVLTAFTDYLKTVESEKSLEGVVHDFVRVSDSYRQMLELTDASAAGIFLQRWRQLPPGAFAPVVLWLFAECDPENHEHVQERDRALRVIESYMMRRLLCNSLTTGGGGADSWRMALDLLKSLLDKGPGGAGDAVLDVLWKLFDPEIRLRWPSNVEVSRSLVEEFPMYDKLTIARTTMVLKAIEIAMRDQDAAETDISSSISIEHIMPRSWNLEAWPFADEDAVGDPEAAEQRRQLVHTIGNLTLVTKKLNAKLSNGAWKNKRAHLGKSVLMMNKGLLDQSDAESWAEDDIQERGVRLAAICNRIWPEPSAFRQ